MIKESCNAIVQERCWLVQIMFPHQNKKALSPFYQRKYF